MSPRRQLPILHQPAAPAAGSVPGLDLPEERPPWHWSAIGAVLIFLTWLPLAMLAQWVSGQLVGWLAPGSSPAELAAQLAAATPAHRLAVRAAAVAPPLLGFAAACLTGGGLVGRFGGQAGVREAAVAGLAAASTAWLLTALGFGLAATWLLWPPLALLGLGLGALGGRLGWRWR